MNLLLKREIFSNKSTIGRLWIDGEPKFWTMEDVVRDVKIPGETAIPYGNYEVIVTFSNRFKKPLPLLLDVPNFTGIRIHAGNTSEDTEGCILIGMSHGQDIIYKSQLAMNQFLPQLEAALDLGKVWIDIEH